MKAFSPKVLFDSFLTEIIKILLYRLLVHLYQIVCDVYKPLIRFLSFLEDTIEFACRQKISNKLLLPRNLVSEFSY